MDSWKWQDLLGQLPMKSQKKRGMLGNQESIVCSKAKQEVCGPSGSICYWRITCTIGMVGKTECGWTDKQ